MNNLEFEILLYMLMVRSENCFPEGNTFTFRESSMHAFSNIANLYAFHVTHYLNFLLNYVLHFSGGSVSNGRYAIVDGRRWPSRDFLSMFYSLFFFWQLIISAGLQVGICDATNSTRNRRNMLMKMAEGKCKVQLNQR